MQVFKKILILISTIAYLQAEDSFDFLKQRVLAINSFETKKISQLINNKDLIIIFSKDCPHCPDYFHSIENCLEKETKVLALSLNQNKKQVRKYLKVNHISQEVWIVPQSLQKLLKAMSLPFSYLVFGERIYPIASGKISCKKLASLQAAL